MSFPTKFYDDAAKKAAAGSHVLWFTGVQCQRKEKFLAFLTSFTQGITSTWNTEPVYGRVDPIATFQGNQRTISISWDVPAGSLEDAKGNLSRFGNLTKLVYPSYTQSGTPKAENFNALTLGKPPLIRIKYANLISGPNNAGLLGYIGNLNWSPVLDMGVLQDSANIYPKVVNLSLDFTVLHEEVVGWDKSSFRAAKFPFGGK